jgi:carboxypeptidase Taq
VPSTWNDLFHESFGFIPPDDARGCLQDIHWSMGGIGYFPTYTLGNINAAQLFKSAIAIPEISAATAKADYAPLLAWLRENIHCHGGVLDPTALMKQATEKSPSIEAYIRHLKSRYVKSY